MTDKTITKQDLYLALFAKLQDRFPNKTMPVTASNAKEILQDVIDSVIEGVTNDGRVSIRDIGIIEKVVKPARVARDIRRGQAITVEAFTSLKLKPSKAMKRHLANHT